MSSEVNESVVIEEKKLIKLNYGCGESKLEGFVNVDSAEVGVSDTIPERNSVRPDKICDIKNGPLPFENESCELIHMFHALEHLEIKYWDMLFYEFNRILIPEGELRLAYPEFERCARGFIENEKGLRDFWRRTLYGRQLYAGDFHVVPMRTAEVITHLLEAGFHNIKSCEEPEQTYNTFLTARKGKMPMYRAELLSKEIFKK